MAVLEDYNQFDGRHWETGTVANFLAYRGVRAPHSGQPYSEALLMGISGGAVMGYFTFAYEGYDPMARILTRNTFDPWMTMLSRLGVAQNLHQTANPNTAVRNVVRALEEGTPAIVWADMWGLPYNALAFDDGMWAMFPILVYGYEEAADQVWVADRANVGLSVTTSELAAARGRAKNNKHRLITLEAPDPAKLAAAVSAGIRDSIRLYTEKPPKGGKNNFGLAAFRWWAEQLTKPKARASWEREFSPGSKMLAGLTSAYNDIASFGKRPGDSADRQLFAEFLVEASLILNRPALAEAAAQFRIAGGEWTALAEALLPDDVPPFRITRELTARRHRVFIERGIAALEEMKEIDTQLATIKKEVAAGFPLDQKQVEDHRGRIARQILVIHDIEAEAVERMKAAMG